MPYRNATICAKGHLRSKTTANSEKYCVLCSSKTFSFCPHCNTPIRGKQHSGDPCFIASYPYTMPYYCHECGNPYPWTENILNNAVELIALDDYLDEQSKELIKNAIPELMVESPNTPIAIAKYKKGIATAGELVTNSLRQLLVDVISETAKKALFGND